MNSDFKIRIAQGHFQKKLQGALVRHRVKEVVAYEECTCLLFWAMRLYFSLNPALYPNVFAYSQVKFPFYTYVR